MLPDRWSLLSGGKARLATEYELSGSSGIVEHGETLVAGVYLDSRATGLTGRFRRAVEENARRESAVLW